MFNPRAFLDMVGAYSLINEPLIKIIWETYQIGVNASKVDCPPKDQECFISRINNDDVNKDNVITTSNWKDSVSFCIYKYNQIILTILINEFVIFHHKNDVYQTGEDTFLIQNIMNALVIEIGKKGNQR